MKKMTLRNYLLKKYSSTSIRSYENMIERFKITMGEGAEKATYTDVLDYLGMLRNQDLHAKSLRNNLFAVKIYFNYLLVTQQRKDHPCKYLTGKQIWKSGINRMINRGKVKYEKITPLKIRQSVIANLLKEKNDVRVVQEFAGHRRTSSTEAYKQTGLEELKQAIDKFHPLQ